MTLSAIVLATTVVITNHASRVVAGEFGGITNGCFVVSGRAYPLGILPKAEQRRVKEMAGMDVRTARDKRIDRARDLQLERIRLREAEGEIDQSTAEKLRRDAAGMDSFHGISSPTIQSPLKYGIIYP